MAVRGRRWFTDLARGRFDKHSRIGESALSKTRLYVECPNCHMQYMVKDFELTCSNGAHIEARLGRPNKHRRQKSPNFPRSQGLFRRERMYFAREWDTRGLTAIQENPMRTSGEQQVL
jgi:hypothetical protein